MYAGDTSIPFPGDYINKINECVNWDLNLGFNIWLSANKLTLQLCDENWSLSDWL